MRRVRYQRVVWHHDFDDEPVVLWSQIGDDHFERRKVDEYRDGRLDYADENASTGSTLLGDQPVPPLDQINTDSEFSGTAISEFEFEQAWARATQRLPLLPPGTGASWVRPEARSPAPTA
jgi:uncharacterized protein DUF6881